MTSNCPPPGDGDGIDFLKVSPCQLYAEVKSAYYALITGNQRVRLRMGERDSWFGKGDAHLLREEMNRLAEQCRAQDPALAAALGAAPRAGVFSTRPFGIPTAFKL